MNTATPTERWILETKDRHGNRVSRRYFDTEEAAQAALEERERRNRVIGKVRVYRAPDLRMVRRPPP